MRQKKSERIGGSALGSSVLGERNVEKIVDGKYYPSPGDTELWEKARRIVEEKDKSKSKKNKVTIKIESDN